MTEAEARDLLHRHDGIGGLEAQIANQQWQPTSDGWKVLKTLQGWSFWLVVVPGGLRITAYAEGGGDPSVWLVP